MTELLTDFATHLIALSIGLVIGYELKNRPAWFAAQWQGIKGWFAGLRARPAAAVVLAGPERVSPSLPAASAVSAVPGPAISVPVKARPAWFVPPSL